MTILSGHWCAERVRMTVRSTSARCSSAANWGIYQSATNRSASSTPLTKTKYRPRGMPITAVMTNPEFRHQREGIAVQFPTPGCVRKNVLFVSGNIGNMSIAG